MKKTIIVFLSVVILNSSFLVLNCFSQWVWQNPYPNSNDFLKLQFANSNTAYIVGAAGTICKTTNEGLNWINLPGPGFGELHGVSVINENLIYAAGENLFLKSTNGGANWSYSYTNVGAFSTFFLNQYTGYIGGNTNAAKTIDGGLNWQYFSPGVNGSVNVLYFINTITGIASGGGFNIQKTTNEGISWFNTYSEPLGTGAFLDIAFINDYTGFIVGTGGRLKKTTDAGNSWATVTSGTLTELTGITFLDSNIIVVCGDVGGLILYSTNGGSSWNQTSTGAGHHLYSIRFSPSGTLMTCGQMGTIVRSTNNGINWNTFSSGIFNDANESFFLNSGTGYVCFSGGIILKTTNSGNNWISMNSNVTVNLNSIFFLNFQTGFSVGNSGTIIKTTNSGQNWNPLNSGLTSHLHAVFFTDELTGYTGGYNLGISKTTDGGVTWTNHTLGQGMINKIEFVNQNTGFTVTGTGKILKTTNAGENWYLTFNNGSALFDIDFPDVNTGYAPGQGSILKTTNCGENWTVLPVLHTGFGPDFVDFTNVNTGFAGGIINPMSVSIVMIGKTTNGGLNWTVEYPGIKANLFSMSAINSDTCYITSYYGAILRKAVSTTGMITKEKVLPKSFTLFQNYPNPFNPVTKIKFVIPLSKGGQGGLLTELKVYDITGREIQTLLNEQIQPGTYEVTFDGGNLPSGIYFYKLTAGEFIECKKMLLIK